MTNEFLTEEIASESATVVETVELPRGEETEAYKIEVKEADVEEVSNFEEREAEGEDQTELVQDVFDDYVVKPEGLDATSLGTQTMQAILTAVFRAWGASESDIDRALEDRAGN